MLARMDREPMRVPPIGWLAFAALACGRDPGDGGLATTGGTTSPTTTTDPTSGTPSEATTAAVDSTTGAGPSSGTTVDETTTAADTLPLFDQGRIPDIAVAEQGCNKVDFLFVIDNSSSMAAHQVNLVNNFPAFIDGIQNALDNTFSYQVGVITTDAYEFNVVGCQQLSSLVVQTGGASSSNMVCGPYADGANFMTEADDLAESFSCAAAVGVSGSGNEQPQLAMAGAVQRIEGDPGECNDGFIRDDALLVVVIIGDEYDNSPGSPMSYYDIVVEAKLGFAENVAVVAIIDGPGNPCGFGASVEVAAFTELWGVNGFEVPICIGDYGPYFEEAIAVIDEACENYVPPAG